MKIEDLEIGTELICFVCKDRYGKNGTVCIGKTRNFETNNYLEERKIMIDISYSTIDNKKDCFVQNSDMDYVILI